ncbi:hypothetical protein ANO11243_090240 [Dothideomycetidae sp. 11243]|nr:hypothetical protein ANO11243_090240 [fungal sp. No.11243]
MQLTSTLLLTALAASHVLTQPLANDKARPASLSKAAPATNNIKPIPGSLDLKPADEHKSDSGAGAGSDSDNKDKKSDEHKSGSSSVPGKDKKFDNVSRSEQTYRDNRDRDTNRSSLEAQKSGQRRKGSCSCAADSRERARDQGAYRAGEKAAAEEREKHRGEGENKKKELRPAQQQQSHGQSEGKPMDGQDPKHMDGLRRRSDARGEAERNQHGRERNGHGEERNGHNEERNQHGKDSCSCSDERRDKAREQGAYRAGEKAAAAEQQRNSGGDREKARNQGAYRAGEKAAAEAEAQKKKDADKQQAKPKPAIHSRSEHRGEEDHRRHGLLTPAGPAHMSPRSEAAQRGAPRRNGGNALTARAEQELASRPAANRQAFGHGVGRGRSGERD